MLKDLLFECVLWAMLVFVKGNTQTMLELEPKSQTKFIQLEISSPYPPQTLGLANIVKSNPIVLVNKKTLYIPNIHYIQHYQDVHFWVGNGTEPTAQGVLVLDEDGSQNNLHSYNGENIYLTLPGNLNTDNVKYFGVWERTKKINLGHVSLNEVDNVPEKIGNEYETEDGKKIMRIPKCCQISSVLSISGCEKNASTDYQPNFKIYQHNQTHINNESLNINDFKFEPYTYSLSCASGKYPLDNETETFGLLINGSLIIKGAIVSGILSQGDFCTEAVMDEAGFSMKILICAPEVKINHAMFHVYLSLVITSMLCFAALFILYYFILQVKNTHKQCFLGYSLSMFFTFMCLTIVQVTYVEDEGCAILGFFFEFAMISSFTWLAILCFDILFIVLRNDDVTDNTTRRRIYYYSALSIGVPLLFVIISLCRNLTPDVPDSFFKPQYGRNLCYYERINQRRAIFYTPIGASIIVSAVCLAFTKYKIVQGDKTLADDYFWIGNSENFKFMWRRYLIICTTMCLWLIEAVISLFSNSNSGLLMGIDLIVATQGILTLLMFVFNKNAKKQIVDGLKLKKSRRRSSRNSKEEVFMLKEMNGGLPPT